MDKNLGSRNSTIEYPTGLWTGLEESSLINYLRFIILFICIIFKKLYDLFKKSSDQLKVSVSRRKKKKKSVNSLSLPCSGLEQISFKSVWRYLFPKSLKDLNHGPTFLTLPKEFAYPLK